MWPQYAIEYLLRSILQGWGQFESKFYGVPFGVDP